MKTSCAGAIRGLWDELNQGLFPWIDDNIGELDARHRLFMAVCEAVIRPREFDYAKWKGNGSADGTVRVSSRRRRDSAACSASSPNGVSRTSGSPK